MAPRALFFATIAALSTSAVPGRAEPTVPLTLTWDAPAECERHDAVLRMVARLAGSGTPLVPVTAKAKIKRAPRGYDLHIETDRLGQIGERDVTAPSCDRVADAAALILSVMLAPAESAGALETEGLHPPPARPQRAAPSAAYERRFVAGVGPRLGLDLGALPGPTLYGGAEAWIGYGAARLKLGGAIWVPRPTADGPRPGAGAIVGLAAGSARGCGALPLSIFLVEACLGPEIGVATGSGRGITHPRDSQSLWLAALPGVSLRSTKGALSAIVGFDAPILLVRPSFAIDGYGVIARPTPVAARATLGVDVALE